MGIEEFNANQIKAIELLAIGQTHDQIAKQLGISAYTVDKWRQNPLFNLEVKILVKMGYESVLETMMLISLEAVSELREIINNADTRTRDKLDAIKLVFSVCDDFRNRTNIDVFARKNEKNI